MMRHVPPASPPAGAPVAARRQRAILDSVPDLAIIAADADGRVTDWSVGAELVLGWTTEESLGGTLERIYTPEDRLQDRLGAETRLALAQGHAFGEHWYMRKDGSRFWARGELMPLRGEEPGLVLMLRDHTAEHHAGEALLEAEGALQRAQVAGGVGVFSIDVRDNVMKVTPEFCRLFGIPVREYIAPEEVEELVLPDGAYLVSRAATRRSGDVSNDVEYRIRRPDDSDIRWLSRRGELERGADGTPERFFGVVRDITEQRVARDALARSESRYRALFDAIDDGFCIIEFLDGPHGPLSDYVHVEANPGYERHTGIPDIVGRRLWELAPGEAEGWLDIYGGVLRTGQPVRFEREFVTAGRHIEVSAARIEPAARRQVSVLFRDVTARKRAEAALRASEAVARENVQRVQLALAAGAIIGTWFWDIPADRFTVDEGFANAFGLDPAIGRVGLSLEQVIATVHPDDKPGLATAINEAIARCGAYAHQYRVRRADGKYYWIEANGRVERGPVQLQLDRSP